MVYFPPAKINLGLQVLRKRKDGYHDISTCFYETNWRDILEVIPADKFSFTNTGLDIDGRAEENLCVKAYYRLKKDYDLPPVAIHLHKVIPMGAGLGGGSADASYTLLALNDLFQLSINKDKLAEYASQLGSDCAFFIYDEPMLAEGKGDILRKANVQINKDLVIVYPKIHVDTASAYQGLTPNHNRRSLGDILSEDILNWKEELVNDFELSIFQQFPKVREVKEKLYELGAIYASMSGSGSAVYGFFDKIPTGLDEIFQGSLIHTSS